MTTRTEAALRVWDRRRVHATGLAAIWHRTATEDRAVHRAGLADAQRNQVSP